MGISERNAQKDTIDKYLRFHWGNYPHVFTGAPVRFDETAGDCGCRLAATSASLPAWVGLLSQANGQSVSGLPAGDRTYENANLGCRRERSDHLAGSSMTSEAYSDS